MSSETIAPASNVKPVDPTVPEGQAAVEAPAVTSAPALSNNVGMDSAAWAAQQLSRNTQPVMADLRAIESKAEIDKSLAKGASNLTPEQASAARATQETVQASQQNFARNEERLNLARTNQEKQIAQTSKDTVNAYREISKMSEAEAKLAVQAKVDAGEWRTADLSKLPPTHQQLVRNYGLSFTSDAGVSQDALDRYAQNFMARFASLGSSTLQGQVSKMNHFASEASGSLEAFTQIYRNGRSLTVYPPKGQTLLSQAQQGKSLLGHETLHAMFARLTPEQLSEFRQAYIKEVFQQDENGKWFKMRPDGSKLSYEEGNYGEEALYVESGEGWISDPNQSASETPALANYWTQLLENEAYGSIPETSLLGVEEALRGETTNATVAGLRSTLYGVTGELESAGVAVADLPTIPTDLSGIVGTSAGDKKATLDPLLAAVQKKAAEFYGKQATDKLNAFHGSHAAVLKDEIKITTLPTGTDPKAILTQIQAARSKIQAWLNAPTVIGAAARDPGLVTAATQLDTDLGKIEKDLTDKVITPIETALAALAAPAPVTPPVPMTAGDNLTNKIIQVRAGIDKTLANIAAFAGAPAGSRPETISAAIDAEVSAANADFEVADAAVKAVTVTFAEGTGSTTLSYEEAQARQAQTELKIAGINGLSSTDKAARAAELRELVTLRDAIKLAVDGKKSDYDAKKLLSATTGMDLQKAKAYQTYMDDELPRQMKLLEVVSREPDADNLKELDLTHSQVAIMSDPNASPEQLNNSMLVASGNAPDPNAASTADNWKQGLGLTNQTLQLATGLVDSVSNILSLASSGDYDLGSALLSNSLSFSIQDDIYSEQGKQRKLDKLIQQLLQKIQDIMNGKAVGDIGSIIAYLLILVASQSKQTMLKVAHTLGKQLVEFEKQQRKLSKEIARQDPDSDKYQSNMMNLQSDQQMITSNRQMVVNGFREVLTTVEELESMAKSYLDVRGPHIRQMARWTA